MKIYFLFAASLLFWTTSIYYVVRQIAFLIKSTSTHGHFIRWHQSRTRRNTYWYPVVSYHDFNGSSFEVRANVGFSARTEPIPRDIYKVRYRVDSPDQAQICTIFQLWAAPLAFTILAVGCSIALLDIAGFIDIPNAA